MFAQQVVYIIGLVNLILAGIAVFCVTLAEDQSEYFSLVYIAISIFLFYMGTVVVIIVLQIIETCQEQQNSIPMKEQVVWLSHNQTLPVNLSVYNERYGSSSNAEDAENISGEEMTTSIGLSTLSKCRPTVGTIHHN